MKNPVWSRDELILALDLYLRHRSSPPRKFSREIVDLSSLLNAMAKKDDRADDFRNTNGVYMKLMNFRSLDPEFVETGRRGLTSVGNGDREVWKEYANDHEKLSHAANAIKAILSGENEKAVNEDFYILEAEEGRLLTRQHLRRERSRSLVEKKKGLVLKATGRLECEACGFDFERIYKERGAGFIEIHHTKPLSTLKPGDRTSTKDLVLLCANCHRMVHAKRPWLTVEELKGWLRKDSPSFK